MVIQAKEHGGGFQLTLVERACLARSFLWYVDRCLDPEGVTTPRARPQISPDAPDVIKERWLRIARRVPEILLETPPLPVRYGVVTAEDHRKLVTEDLDGFLPFWRQVLAEDYATYDTVGVLTGKSLDVLKKAGRTAFRRDGRRRPARLNPDDVVMWHFGGGAPWKPKGRGQAAQREVEKQILWRLFFLGPSGRDAPTALPPCRAAGGGKNMDRLAEVDKILPRVVVPVPGKLSEALGPLAPQEIRLLQGRLLCLTKMGHLEPSDDDVPSPVGEVVKWAQSLTQGLVVVRELLDTVLPLIRCPACGETPKLRWVRTGRSGAEGDWADEGGDRGRDDEWSPEEDDRGFIASLFSDFRYDDEGDTAPLGDWGYSVTEAETAGSRVPYLARCTKCGHEFSLTRREMSDVYKRSLRLFRKLNKEAAYPIPEETFREHILPFVRRGRTRDSRGVMCLPSAAIATALSRTPSGVANALRKAETKHGPDGWRALEGAMEAVLLTVFTYGCTHLQYAFPRLVERMLDNSLRQYLERWPPIE